MKLHPDPAYNRQIWDDEEEDDEKNNKQNKE